MTTKFYAGNERGQADFGWLKANFSFSFGQWYNAEKVHFGALRVLNDDIIAGGAGFGTHPHDNMEIVTIPLKGALAHKDSTGGEGIINAGDVQIMSAGSGVKHSEYNASATDAANTLQVWVFPKVKNITPRYDQKTYNLADRKNKWQVVVSPEKDANSLWINQDCIFALTDLDAENNLDYTLKFAGNGVYFFVLEGSATIANQPLATKDAVGVSDTNNATVTTTTGAKILAIEVPMYN
jgi:quercetin 2,3-dioxygenase